MLYDAAAKLAAALGVHAQRDAEVDSDEKELQSNCTVLFIFICVYGDALIVGDLMSARDPSQNYL